MNEFIIFSDFDGTISNNDVLDIIITNVYSYDKYKEVEGKLLRNEISYEKYLFDMFDNFEYDISILEYNLIDPSFKNFYKNIKSKNIDFYIISSGFKKIINYLLPYVEENKVYGNDIEIENNIWRVKLFDDENNLSINKNIIINKLRKENYKTIFIGDGISDFKVMGNVDLLFCKKDSFLHNKCIEEKCDHIVFEDFKDLEKYFIDNLVK